MLKIISYIAGADFGRDKLANLLVPIVILIGLVNTMHLKKSQNYQYCNLKNGRF